MYFDDHHKNIEVKYESDPVEWLDNITKNKTDLNVYDFIFCDYYFSNLRQNAFQLKLSKYIREKGFNNKLILLSSLDSFEKEDLKKERFDLILDKLHLKTMNEILTNKHFFN